MRLVDSHTGAVKVQREKIIGVQKDVYEGQALGTLIGRQKQSKWGSISIRKSALGFACTHKNPTRKGLPRQ